MGEIVLALFLSLTAHAAGGGTDADGDGYGRGEDCNDRDARVHPGATEICNSLNDDCDPSTSESGMVSVEGTAYGTIQDAVDAAPAGATVRICDGTWYENVDLGRGVTLEGLGPARSIIDGSELGSVVTVRSGSSDVTLRGLTLQHGVGGAAGTLGPGGGILVSSVDLLTVDDCVVADNTATVGAGLKGPYSGDVLLTGSTFRGNIATESGGGADFFAGVRGNLVEIRDCVFRDNEAGWGGALAISHDEDYGPAEATIIDTLIDGNHTAKRRLAYGGGIYSFVDTLTLNGVTISDNRGGTGAGVYAVWEVIADDETLITGNRTWTGGLGGGLAMNGTWTGGTFEGNSATFGGGVLLRFDTELHGAVVQGNHATDSGGGVYVIYGAAEINDSVITENTSDDLGGGIGTSRAATSVFVRSSTVAANVAAGAGGGAYTQMSLHSEASDWGEDATDNEPDDVAFSWDGSDVSYEDFGAAEDFVCDLEDEGTCE